MSYSGSAPTEFTAPVEVPASLGAARQAAQPDRANLLAVTVELASTSTLASGEDNHVALRIAATQAGAATGWIVDECRNDTRVTLGLTVGLSTTVRAALRGNLPRGWWYAVTVEAGAGTTLVRAVEQAM